MNKNKKVVLSRNFLTFVIEKLSKIFNKNMSYYITLHYVTLHYIALRNITTLVILQQILHSSPLSMKV